MIEGKAAGENRKKLDGITLTQCPGVERVPGELKATRDRDAWEVMITYTEKRGHLLDSLKFNFPSKQEDS